MACCARTSFSQGLTSSLIPMFLTVEQAVISKQTQIVRILFMMFCVYLELSNLSISFSISADSPSL